MSTPCLALVSMRTYFHITVADAAAEKIAVVGTDSAAFEQTSVADGQNPGIKISTLDSVDSATEQVLNGTIDAAVVKIERGYDLIARNHPGTLTINFANQSVEKIDRDNTLTSLGISPQNFEQSLTRSQVNIHTFGQDEEQSESEIQSITTVLIATGVMCYLIFLFAGNIGGRVTEEKASHVVEIILATIRPQDLLIGKIIADTIVGCAASGIILAASTIALRISGIMSSTVQAI
nr:ABC transporter permease [Corynebacterium sp. sy039]